VVAPGARPSNSDVALPERLNVFVRHRFTRLACAMPSQMAVRA
jgi:hypothetical protein